MSNATERRWLRNDGVVFRLIDGQMERDDCDGLGWECTGYTLEEMTTGADVYYFTETFDHTPDELTTLRTFRDEVEAAMQLNDNAATLAAIQAAVEKVGVGK